MQSDCLVWLRWNPTSRIQYAAGRPGLADQCRSHWLADPVRAQTVHRLPVICGLSRFLCMHTFEGISLVGVLDQPTPPLTAAVGTGNRHARWAESTLATVGQRPSPSLPLQLSACTAVVPAMPRLTRNAQSRSRPCPAAAGFTSGG